LRKFTEPQDFLNSNDNEFIAHFLKANPINSFGDLTT
jgi:hypothetical protein